MVGPYRNAHRYVEGISNDRMIGAVGNGSKKSMVIHGLILRTRNIPNGLVI